MKSKLPLVVILGATGTGKTKLSLELARRYNGEIISADSMQVYKMLDIITAKATKEERATVPHHLIDVINPNETFTVLEFRNQAIPIISNLFSKNKLPIVVGGTNYYIESLLWNILVEDPKKSTPYFEPGKGLGSLATLSSSELHRKLQSVDPEMAKRLHPNNKRKILRSLEVSQNMGILHSEILKKQQMLAGGSSLGGPLRFKNAIVLWMQCDQKILDDRLNSRVDSMLKDGLINELLHFHQLYNEERIRNNRSPDYTRGIFQSIGFKEFHDYLILDKEDKESEQGKKMLEKGIDDLKMVTRRFARKQNRWINNRFLGRTDREVPPIYGLNTSDVSRWKENVTVVAESIIDSHIDGKKTVHEPLPRKTARSTPNSQDETYVCETCERIFVGKFQWEAHLTSNKHKKALSRKRKRS